MFRRIIIHLTVITFILTVVSISFTETSSAYASGLLKTTTVDLSISKNGTANIWFKATGRKSKDVLVGTATLQRHNGTKWINVASWSSTSKSGTLVISKTKTLGKRTSSKKYRVKGVAKVKGKAVTKYSRTVSY